MDCNDAVLMDDFILEGRHADKTIANAAGKNKNKSSSPHVSSRVKVELQTLRISDESERQLYDTIKHIYGSSFKLSDASEFENKRSNLGKQYWMERGNLVVKGIIDYSSKDSMPKTEEQITRQFATSKLESYGFHQSHCIEALLHTKGDVGKALEVLFYKYYDLENMIRIRIPDDIDETDILERRCEERTALESIYGEMFTEKIKNQIWIVQVKLEYLVRNDEVELEIQKIKQKQKKEKEREVCRLFIHKKCRFGSKCRFLHQQPEVVKMPEREDPYFTLEIRFPDGIICGYCKLHDLTHCVRVTRYLARNKRNVEAGLRDIAFYCYLIRAYRPLKKLEII